MRRTGFVAAAGAFLLLGALPVAAAVPVSFHAPAQVQGERLEVEATLAMLILPPEDAWTTKITNAVVMGGTRHQYVEAEYEGPYNVDLYYKDKARDVPARTGWTDLRLSPSNGEWSSLVIEAEFVRLVTHDAEADVDATKGNLADRWMYADEMHELHPRSVRNPTLVPLLFMEDQAEPVSIVATGLKRIEWHEATTSCPPSQDCPEPSSDGPIVEFVEYQFSGGELRLTATPHILALTGPMDLVINGTMRLPRTTGNIPCVDCNLTGDALTMRGDIRLTLQNALEEVPVRLQADLEGTFLARVNEAPPQAINAPPSALAVVATGVGLLFLVRFLVGLVSQRILAAPLEHPTRRSIYQVVESRPGATALDLMDATGVGEGNVRHHLHILERAGIVQHWRDGRNSRYALTATHAMHAMQHHALDDPALASLLHRLDVAGGRIQLDVVRWAQESLSWARSTTQAKLQQLCDLGLAEARKDGFRKVYRATHAAPDGPTRYVF